MHQEQDHHELEALTGMDPWQPSGWQSSLAAGAWILAWVGLMAFVAWLEP